MAVPPYKAHLLHLPLSKNLTLIMQTTAHPMAVGDNASLHHVKISLVKEEIQLPQSCHIVNRHRIQFYCHI